MSSKIIIDKLKSELNINETYDNKITNRLKKTTKNEKNIEQIVSFAAKPLNDLIKISRDICDQINSLDELKKIVCNFKELSICKTATKTVFSDGNPQAKIMVIGEAPGASEDAAGIPFCGQSGQLMDRLLATIDLSRSENLYITNSIFWRPPGNRKPTNEECKTCLPFVEKHIALINPDLIILVGSTSAHALLEKNEPISQMRQQKFSYNNVYLNKPVPTCVVFHPSYLLRQPSQKKLFWQDLLQIRREFLNNSNY